MSAEFTAEEVRNQACWEMHSSGNDLTRSMLAAYADTLSKPAGSGRVTTRSAVMDAIADALGDAYDCNRVWSAWSYGTMTEDDFSEVREDESRLGEIADAAIAALAAQGQGELVADPFNYKAMFESAVLALADIDKLLGLPEDGCNDPQVTVSVLADFVFGHKDMQKSRDEWVDAQYASAAAALPAGVPDTRTIYDNRLRVDATCRDAAPKLYWSLKNLLDAVEERPDCMGIESSTTAAAHNALLSAAPSAPKGDGGGE